MKAVIFAGGAAQRLSKYIGSYNKHLIPIGNILVIEKGIKDLIKAGINEFIIITNHGWEDIFFNFIKDRCKLNSSQINVCSSKRKILPLADVLLEAKSYIEGQDFLLFLKFLAGILLYGQIRHSNPVNAAVRRPHDLVRARDADQPVGERRTAASREPGRTRRHREFHGQPERGRPRQRSKGIRYRARGAPGHGTRGGISPPRPRASPGAPRRAVRRARN